MLDNRPLGLRGLGPRSSDRGNVRFKQTRPKVEPDPNVQRKPVPSRLKMQLEDNERLCLNLIDQRREAELALQNCQAEFNRFKREEAARVEGKMREQRDKIHDIHKGHCLTTLRCLDSIRIEADKTEQTIIGDQVRVLRAFVHRVAGTGEASAAKKPKV